MKQSTTTILPFCLVSIMATSIFSPAFSGSMGSESSVADTWTIGASALGLQPTLADQFVYATVSSNVPPTATSNYVLNPKFSWGFDVFLRHNFNQTGRDLSISYMGLRASSKHGVAIPLSPNYIYTDFYQTAQGINRININVGDVLAGQNIMLNDAVNIHGILGVAYANLLIKNDISNDQGLGNISNVANESYTTNHNTFHGAGPKVGVDGEYLVNNYHLGLVGGVSAALLLGSQHITSNNSLNGSTNMNVITTNLTNINANIGLRYHANVYLPVNAEVGYKVYDYINDISLAGVYLSLATTFAG